MSTTNIIPNIKKIAVLRSIGLGDFIVALPALEALRSTYSKAHISLLTRPWNTQIAVNRPMPFDRVVPIPETFGVNDPPGFKENPEKTQDFFTEMQKEQFDIAIQLHGGGKNSNPFIKQLGAKLTIGTKTPDALELDKWISYIFYQHEIHRTLEVMSLIGVKPVAIQPCIKVTEKDVDSAKLFIDDKERYVVLHPGASDPRRHWGAEYFAEVGDILTEKGYKILVTGTYSEQKLVEHVITNMNRKAVNLCSKLSLNGLIGLLSKAELLITNDTGPLHLAQAIGTPTVGIFWFPNLINWGPVTRTKNRTACSYITSCRECGFNFMKDEFMLSPLQKDCGHMNSLVASVSVKEVVSKSLQLLSLSFLTKF